AFAPVRVLRAGYAAAEPLGIDALAAVGAELYGDAGTAGAEALVAAPAGRTPQPVERSGSGTVLHLPLPLAERGAVHLARRGDEAVRLLEVLRQGAGAQGGAECRVCPICQTLSALRQVRPEVVDHLAAAAGELAAAVREFTVPGGAATGAPAGGARAASPGPD